jgi:hypothetical protein
MLEQADRLDPSRFDRGQLGSTRFEELRQGGFGGALLA